MLHKADYCLQRLDEGRVLSKLPRLRLSGQEGELECYVWTLVQTMRQEHADPCCFY